MSTQQTNAHRHTEAFKPGRLSRCLSFLNTEYPSTPLRAGRTLNTLSLFTLLLLAGTARGTEYFVATNGLDTGANNGLSWGAPLLTISNGVAKATTAGDIVTVSNGTYNITATIAISAGITVRSYGGGVTGGLVNATNTIVQASNITLLNMSASGAVVDGLTVRAGKQIVVMSNGLLMNCRIRDSYGDNVDGVGITMSGGSVVSNCQVTSNRGGIGGGSVGAPVYMSGGSIVCSWITDNQAGNGNGGGVQMANASALLRNCLVARNLANNGNGAGVYLNGGVVESCTIVSNRLASASKSGGGVYRAAGTVTNSVIVFNVNSAVNVTDNSVGLSSANTAYSCTTPALGGTGNTAVYQGVVNLSGGDYRLLPGPAVDSGTNLSWMAGAFDLAGNPRTNGVNNRVDMGAFEYIPGALQCGLGADVTTVLAPSNVVFTAYVAGTNTSISSYNWNFGDGNTATGSTLAVVTNSYSTPGLYTVTLTVTNSANEGATSSNTSFITVWGANVYAWTNSPSPAAPYATWATAARLIGTAVAAAPAGVTVWATNGTYTEAGSIALSKRMTVRSFQGGLSGASNTIVRVGASPLFNITDGGVVVEGLTIRDVSGGRGVSMTTGLVQNCIIRNNSSDNIDGIGVNMSGGTVSNCIITANTGGSGGGSAGAPVYMSGGSILYSWITDNTAYHGNGGGIQMANASALLRNCVVARNLVNNGSGGGVYLAAGTIESCTIASNSAAGANAGGGVYRASGTAGTVSNSIVYFNTASASTYSNFYSTTAAGVGYTCTTNPVLTGNANIAGDPMFNNAGAGDYTLLAGSPCIDWGANLTWMTGAKDLTGTRNRLIDGDGNGSTNVDMGAYEYSPPFSTTLAWPTNNAAFPYYATITATATVANTEGTVSVQFFTNKVGDAPAAAGTVSTAPYALTLGSFAPGFSYKVKAVASDSVRGTVTSSTNTFAVNGLSVTLNKPTGPTYIEGVDHVPAEATVANANGAVTVTFYTNLSATGWGAAGTGVGGPPTYTKDLGVFSAGSLQVYAVASDASMTATSATNAVTVQSTALIISMDHPNGQTFTHDVSLTATTTVRYGTAPYTVTFHTNRNNTGWGAASGFSLDGNVFTNALGVPPAGSWQIYATVVDNVGSNLTSATNSFTVLSAPTVSLTAPTEGQIFYTNYPITATATASGGSGTYTVNFYTNSTLSGTYGLAGTDSSAPFTCSLNSAVPGTNYIYARVVDGNSKTNYSPTTNQYVILAAPSEIFVVPAGAGNTAPYETWAKAAPDIPTALAYANSHQPYVQYITISNGTYLITADISLTAGITLRGFGDGVYGGLANAAKTIVRQTAVGYRVISITANNAGVDGLKITGARADNNSQGQGYGNGVSLAAAGTVRNCIITDNGFSDRVYGGGVYMTDGTVSNCVISGNGANNGGATGGGVNMIGGLLVSCIVSNNYDSGDGSGGGGVYMNGGTVRNCLILNNNSDPVGGGVRLDGGTVESSTIVSNTTTSASGAGGIYRNGSTAGTVQNCIVYNNTAPNNGAYKNSYSGTSGWIYNDTALPDVAGTGCINGAPAFQGATNGDYRLKACAAVDSGTNQTWMTNACDLAGSNRVVNGIVDMGAYENVGGALDCGFAADVTTVLAPSNVVFTATVSGNTSGLFCWWDFGNGTASGANLRVVTNLYSSPGAYTVSLMVSNANSEIATFTNAAYITAWATNAYAWTNSPSPAAPYTNWATAARLIGTAVAAAPAGVTIWATNGTYNETIETLLYKGITVRSVEGNLSGASNTIVRPNSGGYRLFSVSDANAVLQGLTIQDATAAYVSGCGVNMSAGLVRDCIIRNNGYSDNQNGGGVYMIGGTVSNCIVKSNQMNSNGNGGGMYATGGQILYCQITDNACTGGEGNKDGGGGVYLAGAAMRNCLIARNSVLPTGGGGNKGGGGVYLNNGTIESCTIVTNTANGPNGGGGIYRGSGTAGTVSNSVVYFNTAPNNATYPNFYKTSDAGIGYTCTTNPVVSGNNNITPDPLFVNAGGGDFSLPTNSPCVDVGTNQAWMIGAQDLAGAARIYLGVRVDMGAYETVIPPVLTVAGGPFAFGNAITNRPSAVTNYTVSGTYLTNNLAVTAPNGFQVSTNNTTSLFGSTVTVPANANGGLTLSNVYVRFLPTSAIAYSGNISNSSPGAAIGLVGVTGTGVVQGLSVSPNSLPSFGNVITNRVPATQTYILAGSNLTDLVTVQVPSAMYWISTNNTDFLNSSLPLTPSGDTNAPAGATLSNTTVWVKFAPTAAGTYGAAVTNSSTSASDQLVSVNGTGVVQGVSVSTSLLAFSNVILGRSVTNNYSVAGSNLSASVVVGAPEGYQVSTNTGSGFGNSVTLVPTVNSTNDPGGATLTNTTVWVKFAPPSTTPYNSSVTNSSLSALDKLVSVTGTGVVQGLNVVGGPFYFGEVLTSRTLTNSYTVGGSYLTDAVRVSAPAGYKVATNVAEFADAATLALSGDTNAADGATLLTTTVYVKFAPPAAGSYNGPVTNSGGGVSDHNVNVNGTGVVQAVSVSTTALASFGNVVANYRSLTNSYTVAGSNVTDAVRVSAPAGYQVATNVTSFADAVTLALSGNTNAAGGAALPVATVYVKFAPTAAATYNGPVTNSGGGVSEQYVGVNGTGVVQGVSVVGGPFYFGDVLTNRSLTNSYTVGGSYLTDTVRVGAPAGYKVATNVAEFADAATLALSGDTNAADGATLPTTTVYVRFAPPAVGIYNGPVTNSGGGASDQNVSVNGTGVVQAVSVVGGPFYFGNVVANYRSLTNSYTVAGSNVTDVVTVSAPAGYSVSTNGTSFGTAATLVLSGDTNAAGGAALPVATVYVKFAPTAGGPYDGPVTNSGGGVSEQYVGVNGTGVVLGVSFNGGPFAFGNVITNKVSTNQTYTVSGSNLLDSVRVRTPSAAFQISTNSGANFGTSLTLYPAGDTNAAYGADLAERTVYVRFAPTTPGSFGGSITNTTLGPGDTMQTVSGTGVVQGLRVSPSVLAFGLVAFGVDSNLTYTLAGSNLEAVVVVSAPLGFSVSTNGADFAGSVTVTPAGDLNAPEGVTLPDTEITVKFTQPQEGVAYSGSITNRTVGALLISPNVSGRTPAVGTVYYFR